MPNLSPEDRGAVDAILMNGWQDKPSSAAAAGESGGERIKQVARLLKLLDLMPAEDPPDGLAERTLARIDSAITNPATPSVGNTADRPIA